MRASRASGPARAHEQKTEAVASRENALFSFSLLSDHLQSSVPPNAEYYTGSVYRNQNLTDHKPNRRDAHVLAGQDLADSERRHLPNVHAGRTRTSWATHVVGPGPCWPSIAAGRRQVNVPIRRAHVMAHRRPQPSTARSIRSRRTSGVRQCSADASGPTRRGRMAVETWRRRGGRFAARRTRWSRRRRFSSYFETRTCEACRMRRGMTVRASALACNARLQALRRPGRALEASRSPSLAPSLWGRRRRSRCRSPRCWRAWLCSSITFSRVSILRSWDDSFANSGWVSKR